MDETPTSGRRSSTRSQAAFWIAIAVVVAVVYAYMQWRRGNFGDQGGGNPAVGRPLAMLQLEGLTGGQGSVVLPDLKGKVVLVNFWGVWCPPCRIELPHIAALYDKFGGRDDFRLLAVSCPNGFENVSLEELRSGTAAYLAEQKLTLPTYADPSGTTHQGVAMALGEDGLPGYPTTVLLDREGLIRGVWIGYIPGYEEEMKRLIVETLAPKK